MIGKTNWRGVPRWLRFVLILIVIFLFMFVGGMVIA